MGKIGIVALIIGVIGVVIIVSKAQVKLTGNKMDAVVIGAAVIISVIALLIDSIELGDTTKIILYVCLGVVLAIFAVFYVYLLQKH